MSVQKVPSQAPLPEQWQIDREYWEAQLQEPWYLNQVTEPENDVGKSILVRWLDPLEGKNQKGWRCRVPTPGEIWCNETFKRFDRAITHVRAHLDLKPYPCEGDCDKPNCTARFASKEYRHAHYELSEKQCEWCGKAELRQNLGRHQEKYCTHKPVEQAAEGSSVGALE